MRILTHFALAAIVSSGVLAQAQNNPYGIFVQKALDADGVTEVVPTNAGKILEANQLGASYLRLSSPIPTWPGSNSFLDSIDRAGLQAVWTVINRPKATGTSTYPSTPEQMKAYTDALDRMLTDYHPALLMIENEPIADKFYAGTAEQYLDQLAHSIPVAHAHNTLITDGAITNDPLGMLTWGYLYERSGLTTANDFGSKVLAPQVVEWMPYLYQDLHAAEGAPSSYPGGGDPPAFYQNLLQHWKDAVVLVNGYRSLDLDYVDFHWYAKAGVPANDNAEALQTAMAYLSEATCHPLVTTEFGEYSNDPDTVRALLSKIHSNHMDFMIWFDSDGDPAVGLHDGDKTASGGVGALRPNGVEFAKFVASHVSANPHDPGKAGDVHPTHSCSVAPIGN